MGRPVTKLKLPYIHEYVDRTGKVRRYVRRQGRKTPLPGMPGSPDFMAAYHDALTGPAPAKRGHGHGTLGWLVTEFYASPAFTKRKPSTQKLYRFVLERVAAKDGARSLMIPRDKAEKIVAELGLQKKAGMANLTRSVLRRLYSWAVKSHRCTANPFAGIESYDMGTHHTWTEGELEQYERRWRVGTRERLAYDLLLYLGQRVGDTANMRRTDIAAGSIEVVQEKTGVALRIPIHQQVHRSLKAWGARGIYLIGREDGRPISAQTLSKLVIRAAELAGLPPRCVPHGLRKALMRRLAEGGVSSKRIAAVSGHKTLKEVERYTEAAEQSKLAGAAIATLANAPRISHSSRPRHGKR